MSKHLFKPHKKPAKTNTEAIEAALEENHVDHVYLEFPHSGHGLQNDNALSRQWMEAIEVYLDKYMEVSP